MKALIALHDIGKSLGNVKDQHRLTLPILEHYLRVWGFTSAQIQLAKELVNHDLIGELIQSYFPPHHATAQVLLAKAKKLQMKVDDFLELQKLFYTSDASSYPSLLESVFKANPEGKLEMKDEQKYIKLIKALKQD